MSNSPSNKGLTGGLGDIEEIGIFIWWFEDDLDRVSYQNMRDTLHVLHAPYKGPMGNCTNYYCPLSPQTTRLPHGNPGRLQRAYAALPVPHMVSCRQAHFVGSKDNTLDRFFHGN
eukprot:14025842-Ditylum_brightwellii.AAC.1